MYLDGNLGFRRWGRRRKTRWSYDSNLENILIPGSEVIRAELVPPEELYIT